MLESIEFHAASDHLAAIRQWLEGMDLAARRQGRKEQCVITDVRAYVHTHRIRANQFLHHRGFSGLEPTETIELAPYIRVKRNLQPHIVEAHLLDGSAEVWAKPQLM
jgi:hypothetical protein